MTFAFIQGYTRVTLSPLDDFSILELSSLHIEEKLMDLALESVDLPSGLGVGVILVQGPNLHQARRELVSLAFRQ